jgi:DNA-directed RNA polymerase specialized sigma24 family protein
MASIRGAQKVRTLIVDGTLKKKPDRLPWPRTAPDDPSVQLGVNVIKKEQDVIKLVHKFFKVDGVEMSELLQEVYTAIIHKNTTGSAHDPRKSSFGHYVFMVANNVCINLVHKKRRHDRERDSIDSPPAGSEDGRPIIETYTADEMPQASGLDRIDEFESECRRSHMRDEARYIRAVRTGAAADVVREALSFGGRLVTSKIIRDIRHRVQTAARQASA